MRLATVFNCLRSSRRFSGKKFFLYTVLVICFSLFLFGVRDENLLRNFSHGDKKARMFAKKSMEEEPITSATDDYALVKSKSNTPTNRVLTRKRAWFMQDRELEIFATKSVAFWPENDPGDRIINQLMYSPKPVSTKSSEKLKKILLYDGFGSRPRLGRHEFSANHCPVNSCLLTTDQSLMSTADAVLFREPPAESLARSRTSQLWIMYMLESPLHTPSLNHAKGFNWTATYRHDSELVAPYEKWVYYNVSVRSRDQSVNYARRKTRMVAWFVSNCAANNNRLEYAKELAKYISVDIYGACGTKICPRMFGKSCFNKLDRDYRFYLAFENSNCRDYITEKFFVNGLGHDVVPIVMGAHPDDYRRSAPEHSYIHVDEFASPQHLAARLHELAANETLYNSYFRWRGTGRMINTYFFCRLCAALHVQPPHHRHVSNLTAWWSATDTCRSGRWVS